MKRRKFVSNFLLLISGCTSAINSVESNSQELAKYKTKGLRLTVADAKGMESLQRDYEAFRATLAEVIAIPIKFFPVENRTAAATALQYAQTDIVLAGPSEYVILNARAQAIPIVAIQRHNYYPIIVVRANSKIQRLAQLKGKTIAMRSIGSTSGHLAPMKMLMDTGLDPSTDVKIVMLGNEGILALSKGEVDACAIASDRYEILLDAYGLSAKDFVIIAQGELLPSDVFVINHQLPAKIIATVRSLMLEHQEKLLQSLLVATVNQPYQGSKFMPANDTDYTMIREVYQKIGQGNFLKSN
jgi:phosphonate transport system substrate-binding protein